MNIFLWIIFAAAVITTAIFTPKFLIEQRPGKSKKSLTYKMICASMFVIAGIVSIKLRENTSWFALFMFSGLLFSWVGDFMLHVNEKMSVLIIGILFFMAAHFMYLGAYSNAWEYFFPGTPFISIGEILAIAACVAIALAYLIAKKISLKNIILIPAGIYTVVLSTMFVKALNFSIKYIGVSDPNNKYNMLTAILLVTGAFFFVCSDATLGMIMMNEKIKGNFPLKCFNIITYFAGQLMLASTILFIKTNPVFA